MSILLTEGFPNGRKRVTPRTIDPEADVKSIRFYVKDILYGNGITSSIRIVLGLMFVFSGYFKALDPGSFGGVVKMYNILPEVMAPYAAIIVPCLELIAGLGLLVGFRIKSSALVLMVLMAMFTVFISVNVYRGERFDCGCFELKRLGIGISEDVSFKLVVRDLIILFFIGLVFAADRHLFSIENMIEKKKLENL